MGKLCQTTLATKLRKAFANFKIENLVRQSTPILRDVFPKTPLSKKPHPAMRYRKKFAVSSASEPLVTLRPMQHIVPCRLFDFRLNLVPLRPRNLANRGRLADTRAGGQGPSLEVPADTTVNLK